MKNKRTISGVCLHESKFVDGLLNYQEKLQLENTVPTKKNLSEDNYDMKTALLKIDVLSAGTLFGEIGVLTKLRRTTTVIAKETCLF